MTTSSGSKSVTNSRACAIAASTSSSRSRGGPGRFRSGLWDIQQRAIGTVDITPSRRQRERIDEGVTHLGRKLGDTGARDTAIGTQEYHRFLMSVEPGFEASGTIAHDHDVGIVMPGPVQLSQRTGGDELRPQCLPILESSDAEY